MKGVGLSFFGFVLALRCGCILLGVPAELGLFLNVCGSKCIG